MTWIIDKNNQAICAIVTVVWQFSFFIIAYFCQFDKVTDFAGGTNFLVIALMTFLLAWTFSTRQIIVTTFVLAWGLRLTGYLFYRIMNIGEDRRFDERRKKCCSFFLFWVFQAGWVYAVSLPIIFVNAPKSADRYDYITPQDYIGIILFGFGFLIETVADCQKFSFRNNSANNGKWCDKGLWKFSRHPNYFGEILVWLGIFMISTSILEGGQWAAVLSPTYVVIILLTLSGIPILEKKADKAYNKNESYLFYKKRTSPLTLLPPPCYGSTPSRVKCLCCCEFPCYNRLDEECEPVRNGRNSAVISQQPATETA